MNYIKNETVQPKVIVINQLKRVDSPSLFVILLKLRNYSTTFHKIIAEIDKTRNFQTSTSASESQNFIIRGTFMSAVICFGALFDLTSLTDCCDMITLVLQAICNAQPQATYFKRLQFVMVRYLIEQTLRCVRLLWRHLIVITEVDQV